MSGQYGVCEIVDWPKTKRMVIIWQVITTEAKIIPAARTPQTIDTAPTARVISATGPVGGFVRHGRSPWSGLSLVFPSGSGQDARRRPRARKRGSCREWSGALPRRRPRANKLHRKKSASLIGQHGGPSGGLLDGRHGDRPKLSAVARAQRRRSRYLGSSPADLNPHAPRKSLGPFSPAVRRALLPPSRYIACAVSEAAVSAACLASAVEARRRSTFVMISGWLQ